MIIREVIKILDKTIYRNYSDKKVYIRNKTNGTLWTDVNSSIDYDYEETDNPIVEQENDTTNRTEQLPIQAQRNKANYRQNGLFLRLGGL